MSAALLRNSLKNLAISAAASLGPQRWSGREPRLWVLMYHRILPLDDPRARIEEPGMIVSPATFEMHLQELRRHFQFVSLGGWLAARERGATLPSRACAITFDDGWRDNHQFAWPILQRHLVPATIFVVSDMIGTDRSFWPNRLARLLHAADSGWRTTPSLQWLAARVPMQNPDNNFRETLAVCIDRCKSLPEGELLALITASEQVLTTALPDQPDLMDWSQVRELADSGLITFGSHTRNHMRLLPGADRQRLLGEVIGSKMQIEEQLQRQVDLFCYPNGDASPLAQRAVAEHYRGAVTTTRGINDRKTPAPHLYRVGLHEDVSDTPSKLLARLSCWF